MEVTPIQSPLIQPGQDLQPILVNALPEPLCEQDILCITSKVVAMAQGRLVQLVNSRSSGASASRAEIQSAFAELVRQEADTLFNEQGPLYLTLKEGIFIANAGVDLSNAPSGYALLWPKEPWAWAAAFRRQLQAHYDVQELGVIVTDSQVTPLRQGVTGLALAYAGIEGVETEVGRPDLYARPLAMTSKAVADGLATAAVLLMGEADERTPFVVIRNAPVRFTDRRIEPHETQIDPREDLFAAIYHERVWEALSEHNSS